MTPDFTLFTAADIAQIPGAEVLFAQRASLKDRAAVVGIVGEWFGSTKEGRRYIELRQLETAGAIRLLRRQVPHECRVNGVRLGLWKSDFNYEEILDGAWTVITEDCKGKALPLDKWKRAHVEAEYGLTIRIT